MSRTLLLGMLGGAAALGVVWLGLRHAARPIGMELLRRLIRRRFPWVRQISTADLADLLAKSSSTPPVLLDVRRPVEFAVSHLPGARNVEPDSQALALATTLPADRSVVVYCSIGYRSSQLATRLLEAGFTDVANLEGSIFQWANEGRPLEESGRPTRVVHPYSTAWRWLVRREARPVLRRIS